MRRGAAAVAAIVAAIGVACVLAGCPGRKVTGPVLPPGDPDPGREANVRGILLRELELEVLEGYDAYEYETSVPPTAVSGRVGGVHIGVGAEDFESGRGRAIARWPLAPLDEGGVRLDEARSKRLELHLSEDLSAAWVADEISYRVPGCLARDGSYKVSVVPLRLTGVFVRDGERWVQVAEHLSYPQRVTELVADADGLRGDKPRKSLDPRPAVRAPLDVVMRAVAADLPEAQRAALFATDRGALALWPDPEQELRGSAVVSAASLARSFDARSVTLETWRVGMSPDVGGGVGPGSVAWVAGTLKVEVERPAGATVEVVALRLRATFVLEQRAPLGGGERRWQIVQSHVSAPVEDEVLIGTVRGGDGGDAILPWQRPCEGEWRVAPPAP